MISWCSVVVVFFLLILLHSLSVYFICLFCFLLECNTFVAERR